MKRLAALTIAIFSTFLIAKTPDDDLGQRVIDTMGEVYVKAVTKSAGALDTAVNKVSSLLPKERRTPIPVNGEIRAILDQRQKQLDQMPKPDQKRMIAAYTGMTGSSVGIAAGLFKVTGLKRKALVTTAASAGAVASFYSTPSTNRPQIDATAKETLEKTASLEKIATKFDSNRTPKSSFQRFKAGLVDDLLMGQDLRLSAEWNCQRFSKSRKAEIEAFNDNYPLEKNPYVVFNYEDCVEAVLASLGVEPVTKSHSPGVRAMIRAKTHESTHE